MGRIEPVIVVLKDGASVTVRTAEPVDAERIITLFDHLIASSDFNVLLLGERGMTPEKMRDRIKEFEKTDNRVMIVAEHEGAIAGEISFHGHPRLRMQHGGQFGIGLHAAWRSRGLGRALIGVLLEWARAHPTVERVGLGVLADNQHAIALYKKMGFVEEGYRIGEFKFGPGKYMDDIQMVKWVKEMR